MSSDILYKYALFWSFWVAIANIDCTLDIFQNLMSKKVIIRRSIIVVVFSPFGQLWATGDIFVDGLNSEQQASLDIHNSWSYENTIVREWNNTTDSDSIQEVFGTEVDIIWVSETEISSGSVTKSVDTTWYIQDPVSGSISTDTTIWSWGIFSTWIIIQSWSINSWATDTTSIVSVTNSWSISSWLIVESSSIWTTAVWSGDDQKIIDEPSTQIQNTLEQRLEKVREENEWLCKKSSVHCIEKVLDDDKTIEITVIEDDESWSYYDESTGTLYEYDKKTDTKANILPHTRAWSWSTQSEFWSWIMLSGSNTWTWIIILWTWLTTAISSSWWVMYSWTTASWSITVTNNPIITVWTWIVWSWNSFIQQQEAKIVSWSNWNWNIILSRFIDSSLEWMDSAPQEWTIDMESIKVDFEIIPWRSFQTKVDKKFTLTSDNKKKTQARIQKSSLKSTNSNQTAAQANKNSSNEVTSVEVLIKQDTYIVTDSDVQITTDDLFIKSYEPTNTLDWSIWGFTFGAEQHLVFSDPVRIEFDTTIPDWEVVEILVQHTWERVFWTHWIWIDSTALCRNDWSITAPSNKVSSTNWKIVFYTCGASDFVVIQSSPWNTVPASNSWPVITSFWWVSVASTSSFEWVLAITWLTAIDTTPVWEFGSIDVVSNNRSTVSHQYEYCDPIFVATPHYQTQADSSSTDSQRQRVPRITNKSWTWFDVKVDNHDQNLLASLVTPVHYIVMERWTHTFDDWSWWSFKVEAWSVSDNAVVSSSIGGYPDGPDVNFQSWFPSAPAVLHTVSTTNDDTNVFTHINGWAQADEPTASFMNITLHTGKDSTAAPHAPEDTDWIAFEEWHIDIGWFEADFKVTNDEVDCCSIWWESETFLSPFSTTPQTILASQMWEDWGDGWFGVVIPWTSTTSQVWLSSDEDGNNVDRTHTQEVFSLVSFSSDSWVFFDNDDSNTVNWSIVGGADSNFFTLSIEGQLSFVSARDFDTPEDANTDNIYEVQVQATDGTTCSDAALQTIRVEVQDAPPSSCGNWTLESPIEQCDDGNTNNGDGCTSACVVENDWTCTWTPSSCSFCATSELINATTVSNLTENQTTIAFDTFTTHTYTSTPLVFLTPTTDRNTNNPSIPRVHSITTTWVTISSCVDAWWATCDTTLLDDDFSLFIVDIDAVSCTDHIDAWSTLITTAWWDTWFSFNTPFESGVTPYVFTTPQTSNQWSNIAAHAWVDDNTLNNNGWDFIWCVHQAPWDWTSVDNCTAWQPDETLWWLALDPTRFSLPQLQYGEASINWSSWTPISFGPVYSTPVTVMVTQNSDNWWQDPQYPRARNITNSSAEIRYCESDAWWVCNSHTNEDVMRMSFVTQACWDGEVVSTEACDDGNITDGDGCDSSCVIESWYECIWEPSSCTVTTCGDWVIDQGVVIINQDFETLWNWSTNTNNSILNWWDHTITFTQTVPEWRMRYWSDAVQTNGWIWALTLDVSIDNNQNTNFIVLETDLSSFTSSTTLVLNFDLSHHGDELNPNDKVRIRWSNTDSWLEIYDWRTNITNSWIYTLVRDLDIDNLLTSNSQIPSSTFQIRFGQEDNFAANNALTNDWLSIDNISILDAKPSSIESCDDGNTNNGDGCSSSCDVEADYLCTWEPSVCTYQNVCWNWLVNSGEACDDGNAVSWDGCTDTCQIESGYLCPDLSNCGNNVIDAWEQCDDGNNTDGDGCNQYCIDEFNFNLVTFTWESLVPTVDPWWWLDFPERSFSSGGYEASVSNNTNPYATVLYAPFNFWNLSAPRAIELAFQWASDDDFIGYVFGFQPWDWENPDADFILVRRKDVDQNFNFNDDPIAWWVAQAGLSIVRVQWTVSYDELRQSIDSPNTTGSVTELIRWTNYGNVWYRPDLYDTSVFYNTWLIEVYVNWTLDISLPWSFEDGRFGIFIMAQQWNTFALWRPHPYWLWWACFAECGDNTIVGGETCDDGNTTPWDGCSEFCTVEEPNECIGQWGWNNCSPNATCFDSYSWFDCVCNSWFSWDWVSCTGTWNALPSDITLSWSTLIENNTINQILGDLSTTDWDSWDIHTYTFGCTTPLPDESFFTLSWSQLLATTWFNFEIPSDQNNDNNYEICILTDDWNWWTYEEVFTITILDEYEEICIYVGTWISFNAIPISNDWNVVASQVLSWVFELEDLNGSNTWYYTTLSVWWFNWALGNFMPASIAEIRNINPIITLSWGANPNIQIDSALNSYIPFDIPITYISRPTWPNNGITWYYSSRPELRLTIPEYQAVDTYNATITYTLYEN